MLLLAVALLAALGVETIITITTDFLPSADGSYGAPLPVGIRCFATPRSGCLTPFETTFDPVLFTVDVLITWIGWVILARWSGVLGSVAAVIGSVISVLAMLAMALAKLPVVGLPLPLLPHTPIPTSPAIWLNAVLWAVAAAALVRFVRRRLGARRGSS